MYHYSVRDGRQDNLNIFCSQDAYKLKQKECETGSVVESRKFRVHCALRVLDPSHSHEAETSEIGRDFERNLRGKGLQRVSHDLATEQQ